MDFKSIRSKVLGRIAPAVALCAVIVLTAAARGDNYIWNLDEGGEWGEVGNWSAPGVPDSQADDATITNLYSDAPVVVNFSWPLNLQRIGNLTIVGNFFHPDHELRIANNASIVIDGTVTNDGIISLNSTGDPSGLLTSFTPLVLNGSGRIVLGADPNNRIGAQFGVRTLANTAAHTIEGGGNVGFNLLGIINQGLIDANISGATMTIDPAVNAFGNGYGMNNTGTMRASGGGTLVAIGGDYQNSGTLEALDGSTFNFLGNLASLSAGGLTAGIYRSVDAGGGAAMTIAGSAVHTIAAGATVELSGANATMTFGGTKLSASLGINAGTLKILDGHEFVMSASLSNSGSIVLGGSGLADAVFKPSGPTINSSGATIAGHGTISNTVLNSGTIRASNGVLSFDSPILNGSNGTVQIDADATIDLSASYDESSASYLLLNGGGLNLGESDLHVGRDYVNANFGIGNSFNHRANVFGGGQLNASEGVVQFLNGDVANGESEVATMEFGNVHVGSSVTGNYRIGNDAAAGTAIRGAIQTAGGGHVTDARLSGGGATAGNFGPIAAGQESGDLAVTFNASTAGPLVDQRVKIINNFDNVADQTLEFTGAAYRLANATPHSPQPINFGNVHVGDVLPWQMLTISNSAANDGFSERLNATIESPTAGVETNDGAIDGLLPGQTNGTSLGVRIDTSTGGNKSGTATIGLVSDGAASSGLGLTPLAGQTVNVTGSVYRYANPTVNSPAPLDFGFVHVGDVVQQAVSITNGVPNDGFSERMAATIGAPTGAATTNFGFITGLIAGFTNNSNLVVGVNTATAGAKEGTATITLTSIGLSGSGLGNTALPSQTIDVAAQVNNYAEAEIEHLGGDGNLTVGGPGELSLDLGSIVEGQPALAAKLGVANVAAAPGDSLAGIFSLAAPDFTLVNFAPFAEVAPGGLQSLYFVELDSSTAGTYSGQIILHPQSTNPQPFSMALPDITINVTGKVRLAGDYNGDDVVNSTDYTVWRNSLHQSVAAGQGADGDYDGEITALDFAVWKTNYGRTLPTGGAGQGSNVPEPTTNLMLVVGVFMAAPRLVFGRPRCMFAARIPANVPV